MLNKNFQKTLSAIITAVYLIFYTAPIAWCIPNQTPRVRAEVNKPALRSAAKLSALKLEGDISITKKNSKISLSLRDSDVKQVLRMFADKAGLNIIFHSSVKDEKVTLDMVNISLNDAFKLILQVANLTYYVDNNTMVVMTADAAKTSNLSKEEMVTIPVKYVDAALLADFLNKNIFSMNKPGLSNSQIVVTNPGKNELLVFGTKNDYLMARKIVEKFDTKPLETTFTVNHTTPAEMADLLCNVLFKDMSSSSSSSGGSTSSDSSSSSSTSSSNSSSSSSSSSSQSTEDNNNSTNSNSNNSELGPAQSTVNGSLMGGAAPISGVMTGAAADESAITLGKGVVACQYKNPVSGNSISSLKQTGLTISYYPQRGTIDVLGGSIQQMQLIRDFIKRNDIKQPQAYLEVSIIQLNETGTRTFDNTWNVWSSFFSGSFTGGMSTNSNYPSFLRGDTTSDKNPLSKYTGTPTITYAINYLISNQKGRVLANPRILITNGQTAKIDLSDDYIKKVSSSVLQGSTTVTSATTKQYDIGNDDGITIDITPFISPAGYVTLNIKPKYATIKEKVRDPSIAVSSQEDDGNVVATLLQRQNLDLKNVRIKDGETLVLGGMITETEQKTVSKVPLIGDIPIAGMFFRNSYVDKEKRELVIMITPNIVKDAEDVVNNNRNSGDTL